MEGYDKRFGEEAAEEEEHRKQNLDFKINTMKAEIDVMQRTWSEARLKQVNNTQVGLMEIKSNFEHIQNTVNRFAPVSELERIEKTMMSSYAQKASV